MDNKPKSVGRKPGDGRGRLGGREKGTPNKNKPIKEMLLSHSLAYYEQTIEEVDEDGKKTGRMVSQFDLDMQQMKPTDRVNAEIAILKFHTPQMQATAVDLATNSQNMSLADRLLRLSEGQEVKPNEED